MIQIQDQDNDANTWCWCPFSRWPTTFSTSLPILLREFSCLRWLIMKCNVSDNILRPLIKQFTNILQKLFPSSNDCLTECVTASDRKHKHIHTLQVLASILGRLSCQMCGFCLPPATWLSPHTGRGLFRSSKQFLIVECQWRCIRKKPLRGMHYDSKLKKIGMEIKWKYLAGCLYTLPWEVGAATLAGGLHYDASPNAGRYSPCKYSLRSK